MMTQIDSSKQPPPSSNFRQTPPLVGVTLAPSAGAGITVKLVSTGEGSVDAFQPDREYWYDDRKPLGDGDLMFSQVSTAGFEANDYNAYVGVCQKSFECRRLVGRSEWTPGPYVPVEAVYRMFSFQVVTDPTRWIAALLEQDTAGRLTHVTWYLQKAPPEDGQVWRAAPPGARWKAVEGYDPSASIAPGPWYRYTQSDGA
jgi:hypothetical protein